MSIGLVKRIVDAVESLLVREPTPSTTPEEFFAPAFMREHTRFETFEEFCAESPWSIDDRDDLGAVPGDELDRYVARVTRFSSWREMRNRAAERAVADRLLA